MNLFVNSILLILSFVVVVFSTDSIYVPISVNVDAQLSLRKAASEQSDSLLYFLKGGESTTVVIPNSSNTGVSDVLSEKAQPVSLHIVNRSLQIAVPQQSRDVHASLYHLNGREIMSFSFTKRNAIPLPRDLSTGIYVLTVSASHKKILSQRIVLNSGIDNISLLRTDVEAAVSSTFSSKDERGVEGILFQCTLTPVENMYRDSSFEISLMPGVNNSMSYVLEKIVAKKGVCKTTKTEGWEEIVRQLLPSWHYSWGWELKAEEPKGVEFIPMIWGRSSKLDERISYLKELKKEGKVSYLLGFNEPDGEKQADMTVDEAISLWPKLESVGVPLGSPAVVNAENEWLAEFMEKADQKGLRVDFITVHYYGGTSVTGFVNKLKRIYDLYEKPLWITEFAVADWRANTVEDNRYTPEQVLAYMKALLPKLEEADYIERYSWFSFDMDRPEGWPSALYDEAGNLTPLGEYYAEFNGIVE